MLLVHRLTNVFSIALLALCLFASRSLAGGEEKKTSHKDKIAFPQHPAGTKVTEQQLQSIADNFGTWMQANDYLQKTPALWINKKINPKQVLNFKDLRSKSPDVSIVWDEVNGTPIFISGTRLAVSDQNLSPVNTESRNQSLARAFFRANSSLLHMQEAESEFRPIGYLTDERGRAHIKFQQTYQNLDVWGKEIVVHIDPSGNVDLVNGRYEPTPVGIPTDASLSEADAVMKMMSDLQRITDYRELSNTEKEMLAYEKPSVKKIIFCEQDSRAPHLAYHIEVRPNIIDRYFYFVDANTGAILSKYNATCADGPTKAQGVDLFNQTKTIDTYQFSGKYWMIDASRPMFNAGASKFANEVVGAIITTNAQNTDMKDLVHFTSTNNTWNDAASVSAHVNGATTYEYFRQTHNRNSIDGKGGTIWSAVHVTRNGQAMDNAFWNGRFMAYGDGAQITTPWPKALDGAAHEMSHGVTEHTANLEYLNQSGALNESFSDIFACMVDRDDWRLFEDIVIPGEFPTGAIRDLANPHNGGTKRGDRGWQPAHMNEYLNLAQDDDNGGVHYNSGIPNKAAQLIATSLTREKCEKIAYCALTTKLTKKSQFIDCRLAMVKCAEEIYGANAPEVQAVKNSFTQVGITDGSGSDNPSDLPPVDGPDLMLFLNTDVTVPITLWTVKPPATNANDYTGISQTGVARKPSIADDGSIAVFVNSAFGISVVSLNPAAPMEQILDPNAFWSNVSLSRDKKLLSATTSLKDASIYVFDVSTQPFRNKKFTVYTPSYSNQPVPNTAVYADAMDFTVDNQYLFYDTYNEVAISGIVLGFWEIGAMHVWDNATKNFADGATMRIFPFEPGLSIGNPSLSRNKPNVFTYEVQNDVARTQSVWAIDILTNTTKKISDAVYPHWAYPTYKCDDKIISLGAQNTSFKETIWNVGIGSDGITPTTAPAAYILDAKFPVWFRVGSRPVSVGDPIGATSEFFLAQNYPNPFTSDGVTTIQYSIAKEDHVTLTVFDQLGRAVQTIVDAQMNAGTYNAQFTARNLANGMYTYQLRTSDRVESKKMIIMN